VRELKNVVERAVYRADSGLIDEVIFDPFVSPYAPAPPPVVAGKKTAGRDAAVDHMEEQNLEQRVAELEISHIRQALADCRYNQRLAASRLGLSYDQLRGKVKKYRSALVIKA
jgi:psp operon transcriptional activator